WAVDRINGDAFEPNPCEEFGVDNLPSPCPGSPHQISGSADPVGTAFGLPSRGGYNWRVTVPAGGGTVWVYNAVHGPDWNGSGQNNCENMASPRACSSNGESYWEAFN